MIRLSAFADEISPDLDEQIAALSSEHIHFLDLRGVWNTNVLDLTDQQVARIKETLDAHGIGVAAIGSPIGKVPIDSSFDEHLHHFERAITVAQTLQTPYIRIFSFYPPAAHKGDRSDSGAVNPAEYRDEVLCSTRTRKTSTVIPSLAVSICCKAATTPTFKPFLIPPTSFRLDKRPIPMPTRRSAPGCGMSM